MTKVKPGDLCRWKDVKTGEWYYNFVTVSAIDGSIATVIIGYGEFQYSHKISVNNLEPGENVWRPIAEWIGEGFDCKCSRCGYHEPEMNADFSRKYHKFCMNCGAKMRSE